MTTNLKSLELTWPYFTRSSLPFTAALTQDSEDGCNDREKLSSQQEPTKVQVRC